MESPSLARIATALSLAFTLVACGPSAEEDRAQSGPVVGPFRVSDFYTPSGLMGDGAVPGRVTVDINKNCKQPRPPGAQGDCYHFLYKVGDVRWAGAYWVFPANSWGTVPGRTLIGPVDKGPDPRNPTGPNLRGYNYVRFWAAVDPIPNAPFVQYWAGRIDGRKATPPQPYWDEGCRIFPGMPPRCTVTVTDEVTMMQKVETNPFAPTEDGARFTTEWAQYKIDLSGWSVSSVIGAFGFATNDTDNPGHPQSIYFDDIVWE